ncbi:hypothetical protein AVEN_104543-1 [Araneus ventricosus]|uniref:Uncharacterized protein n=1 Tax=Araneus ventricosus TaxID=182803 RepID=A0A4Y2GYA3_ARAVE|nr:hypothetical protein AVEN_104543-1 [Araneus ventricosus]
MVSVSASEPGGRQFYPGLCSYSVFAIICNEFAMQACGKLAASSSYGDFEACVNLLQVRPMVTSRLALTCCKFVSHLHTCRTNLQEACRLAVQVCCKLKLLSGPLSSGILRIIYDRTTSLS